MTIEEIFSQFSKFKILIVGDIMVDSYLWGSVDRISPEAPVPIVNVRKRENRLGGAANVALNIQSLGGTPILCSVLGNDAKAEIFKELLAENKMSNRGLISSSNRVTTSKTRIISGSQHTLRVDEEITKPLNAEEELVLIEKVKEISESEKVDAIIFEDYDKGAITEKVITKLITYAREKAIPTFVDPKKRNFNYYKNVTLFKPNFKELIEGINTEIEKSDIEKIKIVAENFRRKQDIEILFVTLSEYGVVICSKENSIHITAQLREIADVSGAGDTVISVASMCLLTQIDISLVAEIANIAGGLVCEHSGVVPIDMNDLMVEVNQLKLL